MTANHIDQLAEWWETAEKGGFRKGDTIITKDDDGYFVGTAGLSDPDPYDSVRTLPRAPEPKPAWHDAAAVIAHRQGDYGLTAREVYVSGADDKWESAHYYARTSELIDPVPLIEQKVTDEMVKRARQRADALDAAFIYSASEWHMREVIAAALGLETE